MSTWLIVLLCLGTAINSFFIVLLIAALGQMKRLFDMNKTATLGMAQQIDSNFGETAKHIRAISLFLIQAFNLDSNQMQMKDPKKVKPTDLN